MSKKKSFWPYGITLAILGVVVMGAGTIMLALKHPVQMDEAYLKKYQNVDNHINEIKKEQDLFLKQYSVKIATNSFRVGKNDLKVDIKDNFTGRHADNLTIKVKITRPDSDTADITLKAKDTGSTYKIPEFDIKKPGRWIVLLDITNNKISGYFKKEIDTR